MRLSDTSRCALKRRFQKYATLIHRLNVMAETRKLKKNGVLVFLIIQGIQKGQFSIFSKIFHILQLHTFFVYKLKQSHIKIATTPHFGTFFLFCPKRSL